MLRNERQNLTRVQEIKERCSDPNGPNKELRVLQSTIGNKGNDNFLLKACSGCAGGTPQSAPSMKVAGHY